MLSRELFRDPPAEYRPMPFWFWNTRLKEDELLGQVREMHAKGCGGFFIHARFGLETEYLGDEWFRLIARTCDLSRELGMEVWLYDEESFPSGLMGGRITSEVSARSKFVDLTERSVTGPGQMRLKLPDGGEDRAFAIPTEDIGRWPEGRIDLAEHISGRELIWNVPEGRWTVMVFSRCTLASEHIVFGVDYTDAAAMERFFSETLDPYAARLGEYFGNPIKGIFTDEPTLLPWHHDASWYQEREHRRVIFWNAQVEAGLQARGLDPTAVLASLFYPVPSGPELRAAYWEVVRGLYEATFFQPYRAWCDAHGLEFTGHLLLEEGLYNNTLFQADPTRMLRHMHRPGADHLGIGAEHSYGGGHLHVVPTNLQGLKLVCDTAHISGARRVMTESFGCGGWQMTLQHMKQIVDWQWALGFNFLCPHAVFGSIEGFRKTDAPPCPLHNTIWDHYRQLTDYAGRLSYVLSQGEPKAKVALVYPLEQFQREFRVGQDEDRARVISDTFDHLCVALMRLHYDFEIVPRWALQEAAAGEGHLQVGPHRCYETVIWPFADPDDDLWRRLSGQVRCFDVDESMGSNLGAVIDALGRLLYAHRPPDVDVRVEGSVYGGIYALQRAMEEGVVYYLANVGEEAVQATVTVPGRGPWEAWDCETGACCGVAGEVDGGLSVLQLSFDAGQTRLLVPATAPAAPPTAVVRTREVRLPTTWDFELLGPNMLPIASMQLTHETHGGGQTWRYLAAFKAHYVPWDLGLMFDDIEYRDAAMRDLDLTVRVNQKQWHFQALEPYRWPELKWLPIAGAAREGDNELEIVIRHRAWQDEPKVLTVLPALVGSFGLDGSVLRRPPVRAQIGPWSDFGLSFYSGSAAYHAEVAMPEDWEGDDAVLELDDVAQIVEVFINGELAGERCWAPWRLPVGHLLHPGKNGLTLTVTNTIANFMEHSPVASGLLGPGRIVF